MNIELTAICRLTAPLTLSLALASGCGSQTAQDSDIGTARAAVAALTERDDASVGVCTAAAQRCSAGAPDAAGSNACTRLTEVCESLAERLAQVRDPAVSCWRGIEACEANAPAAASCPTAEQCESLEDEVEVERDPVVSCGERVQACLSRAAEVPESGAACEEIAASCERIGAGGDAADEQESEEDEEESEEAEEEQEGEEEGAGSGEEGRARADAAREGAGRPAGAGPEEAPSGG